MSTMNNLDYRSNNAAIAKKKIAKVLQYVVAIIITIIVAFPIYWMLISSVKSQDEILLSIPTLWPREWHFENYVNVFAKANFGKYYINTIIMTAGILISEILTGILGAMVFLLESLKDKMSYF